jgi:hypothetical protein
MYKRDMDGSTVKLLPAGDINVKQLSADKNRQIQHHMSVILLNICRVHRAMVSNVWNNISKLVSPILQNTIRLLLQPYNYLIHPIHFCSVNHFCHLCTPCGPLAAPNFNCSALACFLKPSFWHRHHEVLLSSQAWQSGSPSCLDCEVASPLIWSFFLLESIFSVHATLMELWRSFSEQ